MVKASSAPATQLTIRPRVATEPMARMVPKVRASSGVTWPRGIGRPAVRCISASMSASYHMLRAPEAPAPTAMQSRAMAPSAGCGCSGRQHHADERREDDERHHARLHQGDEVADAAADGLRRAHRACLET